MPRVTTYRVRFAAYRAIIVEAANRDDAVMRGQELVRKGGVQWPTWALIEALPVASAALVGSTPHEQDRRGPHDTGSRTEADAAAWAAAHAPDDDERRDERWSAGLEGRW